MASGGEHGKTEVPSEVVTRIRTVTLALPEAYEEQAWVGTRWRVRGKTFAHVLVIQSGWPPAYAKAANTDGPCCVLMVRSSGDELDLLRHADHPYFAPVWRAEEVGVILDAGVGWDEITELLTESYCAQAPAKLSRQVHRPPD